MPLTSPKLIALAVTFDLTAVLIFTAVGRSSHSREATILGFVTTLWPFLVGVLLGWILSMNWQAPTNIWPNGVIVWLSTIAGGLFLRAITGQGIELSFMIVATIATGILLIGWRLVALIVGRVLAKRRG